MSKKTRTKSPARKSAKGSAKKPTKGKTSSARKSPAKSAKTKTTKPKKTGTSLAAEGAKKARAVPAPAQKTESLLKPGAAAPSFFLPRDGGQFVSLADFAGRKLVIFFFPRANTPGCTKEAMDFSRLAKAFDACQTSVLGVSADPLKAQESFRNKHQLTVPLISDEKQLMLKKYGAWGEKSMYGKSFMGVLRTTVLVDAAGKIARVWPNVKVDGHAEEVLAAARTL